MRHRAPSSKHWDVVVAGSGFAGSILARILAVSGKRVLLLERSRHPRFTLGESSTPLAAILLETLAERYDLPDLAHLAAYGRWSRHLGHLRRGLKRGFTFYRHHPQRPWAPYPDNENRLLVAASPSDQVADAHWLRADVDAHLLRLATEAGVDYREGTRLTQLEASKGLWGLVAEGPRGRLVATCDVFVDASGGRGAAVDTGLARRLADPGTPRTSLVYAHLAGAGDFAPLAGIRGDDAPYPDDRAAIHHLLEEGWIYVLPFDHGVASVGLLLEEPGPCLDHPEATWRRTLDRYPTLKRQLGAGRPLTGWRTLEGLPHRLDRAAGDAPGGSPWLALPSTYAFFDPLFSTGIAWSLAGVERAAQLLAGNGPPGADALAGYARRLEEEADHLARLIRAAYLARRDFSSFTALSHIYFAAASYQEAGRRLAPDLLDWTWEGFLGAGDPVITTPLAGFLERLEGGIGIGKELESWVAEAICTRNLAGLADPSRRNLYPVDLEALVRSSSLLGLSREEVIAALPHLRVEVAIPDPPPLPPRS